MIRVAIAVAMRPGLWLTAVRLVARTAAPRWWGHWPFLPVPPPEYLRFRLQTQYGSASQTIDPMDVVNYLVWCKDWER